MTFDDFHQLASDSDLNLPSSLSSELTVLAHAKRGQWEQSHDIAQDLPDPNGAWLHAHLHREEGDLGNAAYWYHRANQPVPPQSLSLAEEWEQLARYFCTEPTN